ncbi:MAG: SIR2 family protein, partial [Rhodospirillales bacterium]|nr:SIR2 family protein [Rhodospirillales bacterium]
IQDLRAERGFLFLGCRFRDQIERSFARQIIKRSAGPWAAVIEGELTRNEARFLVEYHIERLDISLSQALPLLMEGTAIA